MGSRSSRSTARTCDGYSIGLDMQQIAPNLRTGDPLPASFTTEAHRILVA